MWAGPGRQPSTGVNLTQRADHPGVPSKFIRAVCAVCICALVLIYAVHVRIESGHGPKASRAPLVTKGVMNGSGGVQFALPAAGVNLNPPKSPSASVTPICRKKIWGYSNPTLFFLRMRNLCSLVGAEHFHSSGPPRSESSPRERAVPDTPGRRARHYGV